MALELAHGAPHSNQDWEPWYEALKHKTGIASVPGDPKGKQAIQATRARMRANLRLYDTKLIDAVPIEVIDRLFVEWTPSVGPTTPGDRQRQSVVFASWTKPDHAP